MAVTPVEAARVGDEIGHTHAMTGLLVGLAVGVLIVAATAATVATAGAAAVAIGGAIATVAGTGLIGMKLGSLIDAGPSGPIMTGSPNTFLGSGAIPAARATVDTVACTQHGVKLIAEGSINVFINNLPSSRKGDKTVCDGPILEGQPDVFFGGPKGTYLEIEGEVPGWLVTTLEWAALIGGIVAAVGAIFVVGFGAAVGSFIGGYFGGQLGTKWGGDIGAHFFGEKGRVVGEIIGEWIGSTLGGKLGETIGVKFESSLPASVLAKLPGSTALNTLSKLPPAELAKLNGSTAVEALSKLPPAELAKLEGPSAMAALDRLPSSELAKLPGEGPAAILQNRMNNPDNFKPGDNPSFWTGPGARDAALANGNSTMEHTVGGQSTESYVNGQNMEWSESKPIWVESSTKYANNVASEYGVGGPKAGEPVVVYVSESANPNSVYFATEKPILKAAGVNIVEIIVPAPKAP